MRGGHGRNRKPDTTDVRAQTRPKDFLLRPVLPAPYGPFHLVRRLINGVIRYFPVPRWCRLCPLRPVTEAIDLIREACLGSVRRPVAAILTCGDGRRHVTSTPVTRGG